MNFLAKKSDKAMHIRRKLKNRICKASPEENEKLR